MKILITGHEGFIGSNLLTYLESKNYSVDGWEYFAGQMPNVKSYDYVIHLGAISSTTFTDVEQIMLQNYDFSVELINLCNDSNVNFQYASSASVYGITNHFIEHGNLQPQSPYAWSKYLFDRYVTTRHFDIKVQGFRYFNVYGKGEEHKGNQASPYTKFRNQALTTGVIELFENSDQYCRDFVCVDDVSVLHEKMFAVKESGIYNVGTGKSVSFETVAKTIAQKYNAKIRYISMPSNLKSQYQSYTCADLTLLNSVVDMSWIKIEDYINGTY
jgi:ADP-L-glycero-D-manno-heptose 6-epimerase